jgi:hypothetical protein
MPALKRKAGNPFKPDEIVKAERTFAYADGVVHVGERFRGGDPVVVANWSAFVPDETLPQEMENFWRDMPPPPDHRATESAIKIGTSGAIDVDLLVRWRLCSRKCGREKREDLGLRLGHQQRPAGLDR